METQNNSSNNLLNIHQKIFFSWYDYTLFSAVLGFSSLIGIYFGCFRKQNTTKEYLLGGKRMSIWPIAISLIASHTSAITLLSIPADIYRFGLGFGQGCISLFILHFTTAYIFLPVFYKLELTSTYEYLGLRFDEKTRMMASGLYALSLLLYLPIVIYVPSLGFSTATGISVYVVAPIACGICIFYTTIGGLKAVVWTDTFQFTLTMSCFVAVLFLGFKQAGGFISMWNTAVEGQRLEVDFDPDPTKRDGFWAVVIGLTFMFTAQNSINQGCVQKFLALPSLRNAKIACFIYAQGCIITKLLGILIGLAMYAVYAGCDPFTTKQVERTDQLVPYFIMDVGNGIPGLTGLFFAGVFCAALSTLSANLNCVAGTLYTDFVSKFMKLNTTEQTASTICKLLVVIVGTCGCLMVYVVQQLGGIVQVSVSLKSITDGPLLAIFTMGVLSRKINSKGAFYGSICGMLFLAWIFIMTKYNESLGYGGYATKPLSTDNCTFEFERNTTSTNNNGKSRQEMFILFRLSFYYYNLLAFLTTILVGSVISVLTRKDNDPIVPKKLLSPVIHWMYPEEDKDEINMKSGNYFNIQQANEIAAKHERNPNTQ